MKMERPLSISTESLSLYILRKQQGKNYHQKKVVAQKRTVVLHKVIAQRVSKIHNY